MSTTDKPSSISGGCLCEAVRYNITFPSDHDFLKSVSELPLRVEVDELKMPRQPPELRSER